MKTASEPERLALVIVIAVCSMCAVAPAQQEVTPNDPYFKDQISFKSPGGKVVLNRSSSHPSLEEFDTHARIDLNIAKAWAITTGSKNVVVAILDDGFCYTHPDLRDNIWHNPGESGKDNAGFDKETNGIDDDHNGYVDDVMGWDFAFDTPDVDCHVFDGMDKTRIAPGWHSMGAMGIIGAKGNNGIGVAGINWDVSMMLLKIGVQGFRKVDMNRADRAVRAIRYAADNGARIINWSGFVSDTRPEKVAALHKAIDYAASKNVLIVTGAGNSAKDLDDNNNCLFAPDCFEGENLMKVAEIDFAGNLYVASGKWVAGSNYGVKRVDIAALGMNYSTFITSGGIGVYRLEGGTSNSSPVVSGVAALMLSVNPALTAVQLKQILISTAKPIPALRGKIKSGGIVDAYAAVKAAKEALP
jgi:subtilisin family serine protease